MEKAGAGLENGVPVRLQSFTDSERAILVNYQLLTDKQVIAVFNTDEGADDISIADLNIDGNLTEGVGEVSISARIEADLCMMDVEEAEEFRADLGLGEVRDHPGDPRQLRHPRPGVIPDRGRRRSPSLERVGRHARRERRWGHPYGFHPGVHTGGGHRLR